MKTETGWIAMTTRRPDCACLLLWDEHHEALPPWVRSARYISGNHNPDFNCTWHSAITHWMPMPNMPASQRDLDESAAHEEWLRESAAGDTDKRGWHEKGALWAFKTERAAILALTYEHGHPGASCTATLERIRERCAP